MPPGNPEGRAPSRRGYLHHGHEELVIHYPATLDANTARRVVAAVLDTGRVPPPSPPRATGRIEIRILRRLWVGGHVHEGRGYIMTFIDDWCVVSMPKARPSDPAKAGPS